MKINGRHYRSIWVKDGDTANIQIIDQRHLPHRLIIEELTKPDDFVRAIRDMHVRGAPLIGCTAAYGMYNAVVNAPAGIDFDTYIQQAAEALRAARPTAIDLFYAIDLMLRCLSSLGSLEEKRLVALQTANKITNDSAAQCRMIGEHGLDIIAGLSAEKKGRPVNILTHCNAGWLACVDYGTATAPIYAAFDRGINLHIWVDETRPRNQGARLTAFELLQQGISHTLITDNAGGHLMQHGLVDMVLVGSDRTTVAGDVGNKIGTYLKALAAQDNGLPFYVALPSSSFDWKIRDGLKEIPIEKRGAEEVKYIQGLHEGEIKKVLLTAENTPAANYAFDVTPARLVTALVTERGICRASEKGILGLFPELGQG